MYSGGTRKWSTSATTRRFVMASAIAVVMTAAFLPASGFGSSVAAGRRAQSALPAGLAAAIHARLGAVTIRSSAAASSTLEPELGASVALSANATTALVGAPGVGNGRGAAYIFHASGAGSWTSSSVPTATLTSKHGTARALFGFAVALSGDGTTAVVGAPLNGKGLFGAGAVYVFQASAEGAWKSTSTPQATLTVKSSLFVGVALALSTDGMTLVVGAPFYNDFSGGAYVFSASSETAWASTSAPTATLSNASESQDEAGFAVAISGDGTTALVGDSGNKNGAGAAYLYHSSAENAWATTSLPTAILSDETSQPDDSLGGSVALSNDGTVALLGAYGADFGSGLVDVFHSSGEAAWASTSTPTATLTDANSSEGDGFGTSVTVSNDGTTALVGAPDVHNVRGAAYIFHVSSEGSWADSSTPTATLTKSGSHPNDLLEVGLLSADGATAIVGTPGVDAQTGAADVFHVAGESSWASSPTPAATLTDKALAACVVPKLKGLKLPAAKLALAVGRCRLGKVSKVHAKTKKSRGRVLSQSHKAGKRLPIHAKVALKVGK